MDVFRQGFNLLIPEVKHLASGNKITFRFARGFERSYIRFINPPITIQINSGKAMEDMEHLIFVRTEAGKIWIIESYLLNIYKELKDHYKKTQTRYLNKLDDASAFLIGG